MTFINSYSYFCVWSLYHCIHKTSAGATVSSLLSLSGFRSSDLVVRAFTRWPISLLVRNFKNIALLCSILILTWNRYQFSRKIPSEYQSLITSLLLNYQTIPESTAQILEMFLLLFRSSFSHLATFHYNPVFSLDNILYLEHGDM